MQRLRSQSGYRSICSFQVPKLQALEDPEGLKQGFIAALRCSSVQVSYG